MTGDSPELYVLRNACNLVKCPLLLHSFNKSLHVSDNFSETPKCQISIKSVRRLSRQANFRKAFQGRSRWETALLLQSRELGKARDEDALGTWQISRQAEAQVTALARRSIRLVIWAFFALWRVQGSVTHFRQPQQRTAPSWLPLAATVCGVGY